ncbi:MAG TPA: hypothetical protein VH140_16005 [Candidatus Acidoferrum sp.]|nr:hypothetical protein [Candidatus Acidoferrum sp.]
MTRATTGLFFLSIILIFGGCSGSSSTTPPSSLSVTVTAPQNTVAVGKTLTFTATVTGTNNQAVTWSVTGGGTISSIGVYTAPATVPNPAKVTVTATSQADSTKSGSDTITIVSASAVQVLVQPPTASVSDFRSQQFTATVTGSSNTAVTWQVNGVTGGSQKFGFISSSGLFVAPSAVPTKSDGQGNTITTTLAITAVSQADTTASATSTVTIVPDNANTQSVPVELGTTGGNAHDFVNNTAKNTITCCGGTLGSLVIRGGVQYILSDNHILARSDGATVGDAIIQPGLIDTATCTTAGTTTVANLSQFSNLQATPSKNVDAAIAQVIAGKVDPAGNIIYLGATTDANGVPVAGAPQGGTGIPASSVAIGRPVAKSGRSTGLTCSTIEATNISTSVDYTVNCDGTGTKFTANYSNQIGVIGGDFSGEGDSGSLIVTQDTASPLALLYAGSDTDTVGNPVADVLNFFGNNTVFIGGAAHQVVGCSLPTAPQSAKTVVPSSVGSQVIQNATATRDRHASELLGYPEVQAVGVGQSYDNPKEAAILFFVTQGESRTNLPTQVDGVRTRIIEQPLFAKRGAISAEDSAMLEKSVATPQLVYSVSDAEMARAKVVHTAHVEALMKQAGVQGVGIGSSVDSPGEAVLMIFTIRGVPQDPIPAVIDGVRTRVRESSRFRAGSAGSEVQRACKLPPAKASTKTAAIKSGTASPPIKR